MLRKQFLITEAQEEYLSSLAEATGETQGHIVRQAIDLHAQHLHLPEVPSLHDEKTTQGETNELKSEGS
jgi:hypothetical protein